MHGQLTDLPIYLPSVRHTPVLATFLMIGLPLNLAFVCPYSLCPFDHLKRVRKTGYLPYLPSPPPLLLLPPPPPPSPPLRYRSYCFCCVGYTQPIRPPVNLSVPPLLRLSAPAVCLCARQVSCPWSVWLSIQEAAVCRCRGKGGLSPARPPAPSLPPSLPFLTLPSRTPLK